MLIRSPEREDAVNVHKILRERKQEQLSWVVHGVPSVFLVTFLECGNNEDCVHVKGRYPEIDAIHVWVGRARGCDQRGIVARSWPCRGRPVPLNKADAKENDECAVQNGPYGNRNLTRGPILLGLHTRGDNRSTI
jgi:hypothetical protein